MANEECMNVFVCQNPKCRKKISVEGRHLHESALNNFHTRDLPPHLGAEYKEQEDNAIAILKQAFVVVKSGVKANNAKNTPDPPVSAESNANWDLRIRALENIITATSDKIQIDHPLCTECFQNVVKDLKDTLRDTEHERDAYKENLRNLIESENQKFPEETEDGEDPAEKELAQKLQAIQKERLALKIEFMQLGDESKQLDEFERRFWEDYQEFQLQFEEINEERIAVEQKIKLSDQTLGRMKRTNVFDDAFHISYNGHFGTINGFRLGNLPSQPVDWPEKNAALGQVVLLLSTLAKKVNFQFSKYKLYPMGSFSKICKIDGKGKNEKESLNELFCSSEMTFSRFFWHGRFDQGLVMLLSCIQQLSDHATKSDPRFKQRYAIHGHTIGGISIKTQFAEEAKWTMALKYMLTNLKYLVVWCSTRS